MSRTELEQEFITDHQKLTTGFQQLIGAVERNDPPMIRAAVESLDRVAGPHMKFEEQVLYPRVGRDRGDDFEHTLLREHQVARSAVVFLKNRGSTQLEPNDQIRVLNQLRVGLDHAISCGALLSHVTVSTESEQQEMLDQLREFRRQGTHWTRLKSRTSPPA